MDSKSLRLGIACVALLGLAACSNPRPMITVPDSQGVDSGMMMGTDSGPPRMDSGGTPGSCVTGTTGTMDLLPLAAGCTPRCSMATLTAINACMDGACVQAALDGDTTPTIPWSVNGMMQGMPLDCGTCYGYQQLSCALDACPTETGAYLQCDPMTDADMCNGEVDAVNTCLQGPGMAVYNPCAMREIGRCFPGGGGTGADLGGGAGPAHEFDMIPWSSFDPSMIQGLGATLAH